MPMRSIPTVSPRPTKTGQPSADLHHSPQNPCQPRHTSSCPNAARGILPHPTADTTLPPAVPCADLRQSWHDFAQTTKVSRSQKVKPDPRHRPRPCLATTAPRPPASNGCGGPAPERPTATPPASRRPETRHWQRGPAAAGGPRDAGDSHAHPGGSLPPCPSAGPSPYLSMVCGRAKPVCSDMAPGRRSGPSRGPGA